MTASVAQSASMNMLDTEPTNTDLQQEGEIDKELQGKCLRVVSAVTPVKLYCCYGVNMGLTAAVIITLAALSVRKEKLVTECPGPCSPTCPSDWIGFGSQCFHFSKDTNNWAPSQNSCMALEAYLALFDSLEELNFLKRYNCDSDHWVGLHRESPEHPWMWTNNTEYNNLVPIRGGGECAYLSDSGISSGRCYTHRKWICSKPKAIVYRMVGSRAAGRQADVLLEQRMRAPNLRQESRGKTRALLGDGVAFGTPTSELNWLFQAILLVSAFPGSWACLTVTLSSHLLLMHSWGVQLSLGSKTLTSDKVQALRDLQPPITGAQILSFLDLLGFFHHWIPNFAITAKPLYQSARELPMWFLIHPAIVCHHFSLLQDAPCSRWFLFKEMENVPT
ncbi:C-type lectin domain family 2 member H-like [Arvicola amphibius]|uniref:C-type lectin domain family 2 member H-like n=1 Tax=Arvicola amphibius TaxID=1047088 RepID=UPI001C098DE4|nr:C-type lectin domain family 2 member H-like [Arvicola amphibius]